MELDFTLDEIDGCRKKVYFIFNDVKIIAFNGAMGAGKTTLSRQHAGKWGLQTNEQPLLIP